MHSLHRFVLTGASGGLGGSFLRLVDRPGFEGLCLLRTQSRQPAFSSPNIRFARLDIENQEEVAALLDDFQPTAFINAAAAGNQFPRPGWADLIRFNVDAAAGFCRAAARIPGCRFIHIGTGLVYRDQGRLLTEDDPIDTLHPYGATKAAGDMVVRAVARDVGVPAIVLRPFSFTGPGDDQDRLFPSILRAAMEQRPVKLSPGGQKRDYLSVHDIAAGIVAAMTVDLDPKAGPAVYNLGNGTMQPLKELIEAVMQTLGIEVELQFGARDYAPQEPMCLCADSTAAEKNLNWRPTHNLVQAIVELIRTSFPRLKYKYSGETVF